MSLCSELICRDYLAQIILLVVSEYLLYDLFDGEIVLEIGDILEKVLGIIRNSRFGYGYLSFVMYEI